MSIVIPEAVLENRAWQHRREIERRKNGRDRLFAEGLREVYDLPYLDDDDARHTLDVIRPAGEARLPVIVEIHGGGYIACEKDINRLHSRAFAQGGFCVVNADYTLHPEGSFAQNMQELADVLRWIEREAGTHGMDASRVCMSGDSAGGHLVLLFAMLQGSETLRERFGVSLGNIRLRAVAATCPGFRLRYEAGHPNGAVLRQMVDMAFPEGVSDEELDALNVLDMIPVSDYPPIIVTTTPADALLYEEDLRLERALAARGRPYAFYSWPARQNELRHVFNVLFPEWEESRAANDAILDYFRQHSLPL